MGIITSIFTIANSATKNGFLLRNIEKKEEKRHDLIPQLGILGTKCEKYKDCSDFKGDIIQETDIMGFIDEFGYCDNYQFCDKHKRESNGD